MKEFTFQVTYRNDNKENLYVKAKELHEAWIELTKSTFFQNVIEVQFKEVKKLEKREGWVSQ